MENKEKILACALSLFVKYGYDGVGVQEICEAAGITKPTLYYYFGSKNGLLEALLEKYFSELLPAVRQAASTAPQGDVKKTLTDVAKVFFAFARQNTSFYKFQLSLIFAPAESESNIAALHWNNQLHKILVELFKEAATRHGNMVNRHEPYAISFLGMLNTYIGLSLNNYDVAMNDKLIYQSVHQFMHGIFS